MSHAKNAMPLQRNVLAVILVFLGVIAVATLVVFLPGNRNDTVRTQQQQAETQVETGWKNVLGSFTINAPKDWTEGAADTGIWQVTRNLDVAEGLSAGKTIELFPLPGQDVDARKQLLQQGYLSSPAYQLEDRTSFFDGAERRERLTITTDIILKDGTLRAVYTYEGPSSVMVPADELRKENADFLKSITKNS